MARSHAQHGAQAKHGVQAWRKLATGVRIKRRRGTSRAQGQAPDQNNVARQHAPAGLPHTLSILAPSGMSLSCACTSIMHTRSVRTAQRAAPSESARTEPGTCAGRGARARA